MFSSSLKGDLWNQVSVSLCLVSELFRAILWKVQERNLQMSCALASSLDLCILISSLFGVNNFGFAVAMAAMEIGEDTPMLLPQSRCESI